MSDEQYEQLNERWKNRPSAMRRTGPGGIPGEFDSVDAFTSAMEAEAEARLRNQSREDFTGSDALKDLGIRIANSVGIYGQTKQLIENDQAAKSIRKGNEASGEAAPGDGRGEELRRRRGGRDLRRG